MSEENLADVSQQKSEEWAKVEKIIEDFTGIRKFTIDSTISGDARNQCGSYDMSIVHSSIEASRTSLPSTLYTSRLKRSHLALETSQPTDCMVDFSRINESSTSSRGKYMPKVKRKLYYQKTVRKTKYNKACTSRLRKKMKTKLEVRRPSTITSQHLSPQAQLSEDSKKTPLVEVTTQQTHSSPSERKIGSSHTEVIGEGKIPDITSSSQIVDNTPVYKIPSDVISTLPIGSFNYILFPLEMLQKLRKNERLIVIQENKDLPTSFIVEDSTITFHNESGDFSMLSTPNLWLKLDQIEQAKNFRGSWKLVDHHYIYTTSTKIFKFNIHTGVISCELNDNIQSLSKKQNGVFTEDMAKNRYRFTNNCFKGLGTDTHNKKGSLRVKRLHNSIIYGQDRNCAQYSIKSTKSGSYIERCVEVEDKDNRDKKMNDTSDEDILLTKIGEFFHRKYRSDSSKVDVISAAVDYIQEKERKLKGLLSIPVNEGRSLDSMIPPPACHTYIGRNFQDSFQDHSSYIIPSKTISSDEDTRSSTTMSGEEFSSTDHLYPISPTFPIDCIEDTINAIYDEESPLCDVLVDSPRKNVKDSFCDNLQYTNLSMPPVQSSPSHDMHFIHCDVNLNSVSKIDSSMDCLRNIFETPLDDFQCMNSSLRELMLPASITLSPIKFNPSTSIEFG